MPPQSDNGGHSILAPSAASRWSVCTASVGYIEANKARCDFGSSVFADEGTEAHALAANWLIENKEPKWPEDKPGEMKYAEMRKHVTAYIHMIEGMIGPGDHVAIEKKVPLFYGKGTGTVDCRIVNRAKKQILIIDLKYGQGVGVHARENKQLAIYAESSLADILEMTDSWLVSLIIFQPRDRNDDNAVRQWNISRADLRAFVAPLVDAVNAIKEGKVEFHPDPETTCKWCPAKKICDARQTYGLERLPEGTDVLAPIPSIPTPASLTREQRGRVIKARKEIEDWLEAVEDYEVAELMRGIEPHGFKLVEGKSNRAWKDETKVEQMLAEFLDSHVIRPPAVAPIITVAAAEKLIGKKEFSSLAKFIGKPEGKPTLVDVGDKRPALTFGPTKDFGDLDKPGNEFI